MPLIDEQPQRLHETRHLVAELRALQDRLNGTLEQLCSRAAELGADGAGDAADEGPRTEASMVPDFLALPLRSAFLRNPATATALGPETKFYSNYRKGLLQIVQQPRPAAAEQPYQLIINYADLDADLLSLVIDARALLGRVPAGRARLNLVLEIHGFQHNALFAKCAWKTGPGKWQDRTVEVRANQVAVASFEIDGFDPAVVQGLDIHLLCNPSNRGSIEIRRLQATLVVQPRAAESAAGADVFEEAP